MFRKNVRKQYLEILYFAIIAVLLRLMKQLIPIGA